MNPEVNVFTHLNKEVLMFLDIIPSYDGNVKTLNDFITSTEDVIEIINQSNPSEITKKLIILTIKKKIIGHAKELLSGATLNSWGDIKLLLTKNYGDKRNAATLLMEICDLKQTNEPILLFHQKYVELFLLFKSKIELDLQQTEIKTMYDFGQQFATQSFIKNCREPYRSQLSARHPSTLGEISNLITNDLQYVKIQNQSKSLFQTSQNQYQTPMTRPKQNQTQTSNYKHQSPMSKFPNSQQNQSQRQPVQVRPVYKPTPMSITTRTYRPNNNFTPQTRPTFVSEELFNAEQNQEFDLEDEEPLDTNNIETYEYNNENVNENENFPVESEMNLNP